MAENNFTTSCGATGSQTGFKGCGNDIGRPVALIVCPSGTEVAADAATAILEATYETGINDIAADRWYPVMGGVVYEPGENAEIYHEMDDESEWVKTTSGERRIFYKLNSSGYSEKEWARVRAAINTGKKEIIIIDINKNMRGVTDLATETKFLSIPVTIRAETAKDASNEEIALAAVYWKYKDVNEFTDLPATVKPIAFDPRDLQGIKAVQVTLESGEETETDVTVNLAYDTDGSAVSGLADNAADWKILDSNGDAVVVTLVAESATVPGQYVLSAILTAGTYTVTMAAPSDQTTKYLEAVTSPVSFTTSA